MRNRKIPLAAAATIGLATFGASGAHAQQSSAEFNRVQRLIELQSRTLQEQAQSLNALQARLRQLETEQQRNTQRVDAVVQQERAAPRAIPASAPARGSPAQPVLAGGDKVRVTLSGQVNRMMLMHRDGSGKLNTYFTDNDASSTRLRLLGAADLSNDLTASSAIEFDMRSNASGSAGRANANNNGGGTPVNGSFRLRRAEAGLASKEYGAVLFGRGSMFADGIANIDLSGTSIALYATGSDTYGGMSFANKSGPHRRGSDPTMGQVFDALSGWRDDRVRYDTPTWNGFTAGGSVAQGAAWDIGLRYAGKLDGVQVAGGIAYMNLNGQQPRNNPLDGSNPYWARWSEKASGSLSVLLPNGLNATVSGGWGKHHDDCCSTTNIATDDAGTWFTKIGYQASIFDIGKTAFAVQGGQSFNSYQNGDIASRVGFSVDQPISDKGIELYAGYEHLTLHRSGANFDASDVALIGTRIQF